MPGSVALLPTLALLRSPPPLSAQRPIDLLVVRAQRGDRAAMHTLYDDHVRAVFGYCLAFCRGDRDAASDLCHESFAKAFAALGELRDPARFSGWLRTLTRRTCLRWADQRRTERAALERLAREPGPVRAFPERASAVVAEVIEACPDPGLRDTARLFYTDPPHSTAEIAASLGVSRTAVTTRLLRFRKWAAAHMLVRLSEALEESP